MSMPGNLSENFSNISSSIIIKTVYSFHRTFTENVFGCCIATLIAVTAILGNTAVVLASFWDETIRRQTGNILIVYLAFVDIFTALLVQLPSAVSIAMDHWPFGTFYCKMNTGLNYMFACASSIAISFIGIDRAFAILYPLRYGTLITDNTMTGFCVFNILFCIMAFSLTYISNHKHYDYFEATCAYEYFHHLEVFYLFMSGFSLCYVIPACIFVVCNYIVLRSALKSGGGHPQQLFVRRQLSKGRMVSQISAINKTLKSMIAIICAYFMCFTPYSLAKLAKVLTGRDMPPWFNMLTTILLYVSSAVNPFIYGILRKDFRNAFKKLPITLKEKIFQLKVSKVSSQLNMSAMLTNISIRTKK